MTPLPTFAIEMVKLQGGGRLIRVGDPLTGTWIERPLNPDLPVVEQKRLMQRALGLALQAELKESA